VTRPRPERRWAALALGLCFAMSVLTLAYAARAADKKPPPRDARFEWDLAHRLIYVSVSFRDIVDAGVRRELTRGLPTTIVFTGTIFLAGTSTPLSTTAQTCKITYDVWQEAYRIEITRPGRSFAQWTTTTEGVLRRCAEARLLLAGNDTQVPFGSAVYMHAKVQVNPVSQEMLEKIRRWVLRPSGTATATPGDALFSTFTGLFLQRIGDADRELKFETKTVQPIVPKPPPPPKPKPRGKG
jgi:hypothetical protein